MARNRSISMGISLLVALIGSVGCGRGPAGVTTNTGDTLVTPDQSRVPPGQTLDQDPILVPTPGPGPTGGFLVDGDSVPEKIDPTIQDAVSRLRSITDRQGNVLDAGAMDQLSNLLPRASQKVLDDAARIVCRELVEKYGPEACRIDRYHPRIIGVPIPVATVAPSPPPPPGEDGTVRERRFAVYRNMSSGAIRQRIQDLEFLLRNQSSPTLDPDRNREIRDLQQVLRERQEAGGDAERDRHRELAEQDRQRQQDQERRQRLISLRIHLVQEVLAHISTQVWRDRGPAPVFKNIGNIPHIVARADVYRDAPLYVRDGAGNCWLQQANGPPDEVGVFVKDEIYTFTYAPSPDAQRCREHPRSLQVTTR